MNLRVYLGLFRPVSSLTFTAIYTMVAAGEAYLFHLDFKTERFLACAVAMPLLLGFSLAGAVHEPMHRSFVLLLPNATQILRRTTIAAMLIFAVFATLASVLANPSIPPQAIFGLTCALLALPCIDRHNYLYGVGGMLVALVAWIAINALVGVALPVTMAAAPWAFCAGGIAIAVAAIANGFSRQHLRERVRFYFHTTPGSFALIFDPRITALHRQERLLSLECRGSGTMNRGRDWPVRSVGASTGEWMRVLLHGFWGRQRNGSFPRAILNLTGRFAINIFGLPFLLRVLDHLMTGPNALPSYWEILARATGPVSIGVYSHNLPMAVMSTIATCLQSSFAAIFAMSIVRPQLPYPISRQRLARTVFGLSLLQLSVAILVPGLVLFLVSFLGQLLSGQLAADYGLHSVIGIDLLLAIALPLLSCNGMFKHSTARFLWYILIATTLTAAALLRDQWISTAFTPSGLLIAISSSAGAIGLLWLSLQRQYRVRDLLFEPGPLGNAPA